jgi:hypothetical protein
MLIDLQANTIACTVSVKLCRGTLARQAATWRPEIDEGDMLRLLHLLRDVAQGLNLLKSRNIVHADLVSCLVSFRALPSKL